MALGCVLAGLLAALAHPPFGFLPGLVGYAAALWLLDQGGHRQRGWMRISFWRGWLFGTAYFFVGTWWVGEAFLVDIAVHGWMAPIAILALAGGLGLFWGLAGLGYVGLNLKGPGRIAGFVLTFSVLEWLRGRVLTGFGWNLPGETWAAGSAPSQVASLVGAYGLTFITLWIAASAVLVLDWRKAQPSARPRVMGMAGVGLILLIGVYGFGAWRLSQVRPSEGLDGATGPVVRIVQADIAQSAKWTPENFRMILDKYVALSQQPSKGRAVDVIVWPEGAIPAAFDDYLAPDTWTREAVIGALRPGQSLLVGGYRSGVTPEGPIYFNSLLGLQRVGNDLKVTGVYDKFRLVPFGEYLPLGEVLTKIGLRALVHAPDDFTPGPRPRPVKFDGLPLVQPLICYESLFPGFTREGAKAAGRRAAWILNVSNDAWFGRTSGPWQHLNIASYRAIEEGLPMIRSTPTGISAVIDAYGRRSAQLSLGQGDTGIIDAVLPSALPTTLFGRFGDWGLGLMLLVSMTIIIVQKRAK
jgi:apolipoprotein N-acyltransferase